MKPYTIEFLKTGYDMGKKSVDLHKFEGNRALDIGCGHCAHTLAYAEKFNRIDAIDINDRVDRSILHAISPAVVKINFVQQDIHTFPMHSYKYDLIFSLSAFEHIQNWQDLLPQIVQSLSPKGLFQMVISPLYYSPLGHHLDPVIGEWSHILLPEYKLKQFYFKNGGVQWAWNIYTELNKLTAADFISEAEAIFDTVYLTTNIITIHYVGRKK